MHWAWQQTWWSLWGQNNVLTFTQNEHEHAKEKRWWVHGVLCKCDSMIHHWFIKKKKKNPTHFGRYLSEHTWLSDSKIVNTQSSALPALIRYSFFPILRIFCYAFLSFLLISALRVCLCCSCLCCIIISNVDLITSVGEGELWKMGRKLLISENYIIACYKASKYITCSRSQRWKISNWKRI